MGQGGMGEEVEGRREERKDMEQRGEKEKKGGRTLMNILTHQSILLFPHILVCLKPPCEGLDIASSSARVQLSTTDKWWLI